MDEKALDRILGSALRSDDRFLGWVIDQTAFAKRRVKRVLVRDDWPWGAPKGEQSKFRETDVLLVCEDVATSERFGLHFENKSDGRGFEVGQASDYPKRARAWAGVAKWGGYSLWECLLIAPSNHLQRYPDDCKFFDRHISYESVAVHLPAFCVGSGATTT